MAHTGGGFKAFRLLDGTKYTNAWTQNFVMLDKEVKEYLKLPWHRVRTHHAECIGVFNEVNVTPDNYFQFDCLTSPKLCKCIVDVAKGNVPMQTLRKGDIKFSLFKDEKGTVSYNATKKIFIGDVNSGSVRNAIEIDIGMGLFISTSFICLASFSMERDT